MEAQGEPMDAAIALNLSLVADFQTITIQCFVQVGRDLDLMSRLNTSMACTIAGQEGYIHGARCQSLSSEHAHMTQQDSG